MKKSIFLMALLCLIVSLTFAQNKGGAGSLDFGVLSKGCTGFSTCQITHEPTMSVQGHFSYSQEEGIMLIEVKIADVSEELFNHKGENLYFSQLETISVDPVLCRKIGAMGTLQIQKGNFQVTESRDGSKYIIHLIVKEVD